MPPAKKTAAKTKTNDDTPKPGPVKQPLQQQIDSTTLLGENQDLNKLAELILDGSMSILSHCYNANNNALILDYVIRRISVNGQGVGHLKLFNINWDYMVNKCNPKYILRPYEREDYHFPIYEFPETLPNNQVGYLIDFKKMRYKTYPIILAVLEFLITTKSFVERTTKPLVICYHIESCLGSYYYKFAELLEKYPEHYYWFLHGGTETPKLYNHKLLGMIQYYKIRLSRPSSRQTTSSSKLLIGKQIVDKKLIDNQIWDLVGEDLIKYLILQENALNGSNTNSADYILNALPVSQILLGFLAKLKSLKHMNDLAVCYQAAYAINTLGYSIAQVGKLLIKLIKWHQMSNKKFAPELGNLATQSNLLKIIKMFADYDVGKYKDKSDQIPIFQQLMIELARIQMSA